MQLCGITQSNQNTDPNVQSLDQKLVSEQSQCTNAKTLTENGSTRSCWLGMFTCKYLGYFINCIKEFLDFMMVKRGHSQQCKSNVDGSSHHPWPLRQYVGLLFFLVLRMTWPQCALFCHAHNNNVTVEFLNLYQCPEILSALSGATGLVSVSWRPFYPSSKRLLQFFRTIALRTTTAWMTENLH